MSVTVNEARGGALHIEGTVAVIRDDVCGGEIRQKAPRMREHPFGVLALRLVPGAPVPAHVRHVVPGMERCGARRRARRVEYRERSETDQRIGLELPVAQL